MKTNLSNAAIAIVLLASVGLNVAQMRELKELRGAAAVEMKLSPGAAAIPVEAHDLEGNPVTIDYDRQKLTILYVFSPQCGWCERNLANVAALATQASGRYSLIGLSITDEGVRDYVQRHNWKFPVYAKPSREAIEHLKLRSTPHTLVISPDRLVLQSWTGAFAGPVLSEIQSAFGFHLPGLTQ